ncbi:MAG: mechanosensitive ion channel family protein [Chloroflexi bacterium]|nr:mechanosensitive ion channel family protein [Chloroflexota bacterium]
MAAVAIDWYLIAAWLLGHGLRLILIAVLALAVYAALKRAAPHMCTLIVKGEEEHPEEIAKRSATLCHFTIRIGAIAISLAAAFMALSVLELDIAPVLAGVGIVGIAVGFGAQSLVKDIMSGVFILVENQFRKGDVVKVAGVSGLVEEVGLRRTVLRDLDGTVHTIPNGEIRVASNLTRGWSQVNMNVTVAYKEDLDRVIEVIDRVGRELATDKEYAPLVLEAPHVLRVDEFQESGIAIKVLGKTRPIKQWEVMGELRRRLKKAFDEEGIEIPFPHRVVIKRE